MKDTFLASNSPTADAFAEVIGYLRRKIIKGTSVLYFLCYYARLLLCNKTPGTIWTELEKKYSTGAQRTRTITPNVCKVETKCETRTICQTYYLQPLFI